MQGTTPTRANGTADRKGCAWNGHGDRGATDQEGSAGRGEARDSGMVWARPGCGQKGHRRMWGWGHKLCSHPGGPTVPQSNIMVGWAGLLVWKTPSQDPVLLATTCTNQVQQWPMVRALEWNPLGPRGCPNTPKRCIAPAIPMPLNIMRLEILADSAAKTVRRQLFATLSHLGRKLVSL